MVQRVGVSVSVWVTGTLWAPDLGRKEENQQENQARRAAFISEQYMTLSCLTVFLLERLSGKQMECLLLCSKNNIWTNPATLIIRLHTMFICKKC